ncbi:hypothetical protein CDAR_9141 [Caerostris darwini]|uniref:Uncharacterized protein n=1 Tax=Caerostris darwini TaxID=1538125 RepID=A0AAV4UY86_9ARAC|nr:hypothetical protein CDAR_9141 [Caerostris darwini]
MSFASLHDHLHPFRGISFHNIRNFFTHSQYFLYLIENITSSTSAAVPISSRTSPYSLLGSFINSFIINYSKCEVKKFPPSSGPWTFCGSLSSPAYPKCYYILHTPIFFQILFEP